MTRGAQPELVSVQYLRSVAATIVIVAHAFAHPLSEPPVWTWTAGRTGVTLFFVISGFIMTVITPAGALDPLDFMKRRILRVVPLYWCCTIFIALLAWLGLPFFRRTIFDVGHLVGSLFFIPMFRPGNPGAVEPFVKLGWTLNYEFFFYACFASLWFLNRFWRTLTLCVLMVALATLGRLVAFESAPLRFITGYDVTGFAGGAAVGLAFANGWFRARHWRVATAAALVLVAIFLLVALRIEDRSPLMALQGLLVLASASVVLALALAERAGRLVEIDWLERLGSASYSAYLFHMFPIGALSVLAAWLLGAEPSGVLYLLVGAVGALAGLAVGWLVYVHVERPLLRVTRAMFLAPGRGGAAPNEGSPR